MILYAQNDVWVTEKLIFNVQPKSWKIKGNKTTW